MIRTKHILQMKHSKYQLQYYIYMLSEVFFAANSGFLVTITNMKVSTMHMHIPEAFEGKS